MNLTSYIDFLKEEVLEISDLESPNILGLTNDSRKVKAGFLFVIIQGNNENGNQYVNDAIKNGAVAILTENNDLKISLPFIKVRNARKAYSLCCALFFGFPGKSLALSAITGTNGKSTTAFLIRHILDNCGVATGLFGTLGTYYADVKKYSDLTTPDAYEIHKNFTKMLKYKMSNAVLEVSSHALDQERIEGCLFETAVFTNLSGDHLDYHSTMENYFGVKKKLFTDFLKDDALKIICVEDDWGKKLKKEFPESISYGFAESADAQVNILSCEHFETRFSLRFEGEKYNFKIPLIGHYNILNTVAAILTCWRFCKNIKTISDVLANFPGVPGRLQRITKKGHPHIFIDYSHTDDALDKTLDVLKSFTKGRLITIFGCGGDRDVTKRPRMAAVSEKYSDYSIVTDDNPRTENPYDIISDIEKGFKNKKHYQIIHSRFEAIETALHRTEENDVILIAGKGHEDYQIYGTKKSYFSDYETVLELINE